MISASVSASSSSSTGPVQFGNVKSGSIGVPPWVVLVGFAVLVIGGIVFLVLGKKSK